jgi:hypothetical protein
MRTVKVWWKDGIAGALALSLAICVGSDAQAKIPMHAEVDPASLVASRIPELPAHLRGIDTSKITSRVFYRTTVPGAGAWQGSQSLPAPQSMLMLGSGLMALGVLVRRLRPRDPG